MRIANVCRLWRLERFLPLMLLLSSSCSKSVQGRGDGAPGATGGSANLGGERNDSGGNAGDGDGDGSLGGDTGNGGSGGTEGSGGSDGTGGESMLTCAGESYPAPLVMGDFGCQEFDGTWPPESPWSLVESEGSLSLQDSLFVTSPYSLAYELPDSGPVDAKVTWENVAGSDVSSVHLKFQMNPAAQGAPALWDDPVKLACVQIGQTEGCLQYQRGMGSYGLIVTQSISIPTIVTCDFPGAPQEGSWNDVSILMDDTGELTVSIEGNDEVICDGPVAVGTVARAWIGMEAPDGFRTPFDLGVENLVVQAQRQ